MHDNAPPSRLHAAATQPPTTFTTTVKPNGRGEWLTVVDLGDGICLSKLFAKEDAARRYGDELAAWLRHDHSE
jgi:hypothetical protein